MTHTLTFQLTLSWTPPPGNTPMSEAQISNAAEFALGQELSRFLDSPFWEADIELIEHETNEEPQL